jgi:hypothetical protein
MRIISTYNDYYDCMQAHGQDQSFVYSRNPEIVEYEHQPPHWSKNTPGNFWSFPEIRGDKNFYITEYIIGFCGKIYPVLHLRKDVMDVPTVCHNGEDVDKFVNAAGYKKKQVEEYFSAKKKSYWRSRWRGESQTGILAFFNECADQQDKHEKIFQESGSPIFEAVYRDRYRYDLDRTPHWKPSKITFNAELKKHCFYRVFPTALAFQEISMYLGGVLGQGNPVIPEVSNSDMIEAKGFDLKKSFRKEKKKSK